MSQSSYCETLIPSMAYKTSRKLILVSQKLHQPGKDDHQLLELTSNGEKRTCLAGQQAVRFTVWCCNGWATVACTELSLHQPEAQEQSRELSGNEKINKMLRQLLQTTLNAININPEELNRAVYSSSP